MADQGADVIKVEAPGGDHTRAGANRRNGFSASFLNNNRGKRSVVLDLKAPGSLQALLRLSAGADVFVQNFRPGVADRIGIGEAAIRAVAPKVVYVSISGFGEQGPYAGKPVYDPLMQAMSGLATVQAGSDEARPRLVRTIVPDKLTGVVASQAITAALLARARTGEGQHIRLSMLGAVVAFLWGSDMGSETFVGDDLPQQEAASFADLIYETADGFISLAVQSDREWVALILPAFHGRVTPCLLLAVLPGLACGSPGPGAGAGGCRSPRRKRTGRAWPHCGWRRSGGGPARFSACGRRFPSARCPVGWPSAHGMSRSIRRWLHSHRSRAISAA